MIGRELDIVIRGGIVMTMNAERDVRSADVVIRDDRIASLGEAPTRGARAIDATGCAVLPGFVQAHVHLCQALFRGMADDLPLLTWLRERIWPFEAAHDERSLRASARLGLAEMIRAGTTSILDMGTVHHHDVVFESMEEFGIRGLSGKTMMDRGEAVPSGLLESTKTALDSSERLCTRWNRSASGRLGYAFAPRFILSCSEELLQGTAALARTHRARIHSHASEHLSEREEVRLAFDGYDDIEVLAKHGIAGSHVVLAHGVQLGRAQMKRMANQGTSIAHCPSANLKLASGIADVVAMREAGITVGIGADGAPCNNRMDPLLELRHAALLAKVKRKNAAALDAMSALAMATIDGAKALGLDHEVGSIEVGKKADLIVLRLDDLHHQPSLEPELPGDIAGKIVYSAVASDVRHVLVDGRHLVRDGALVHIDTDAVSADARREAVRLLKRVQA